MIGREIRETHHGKFLIDQSMGRDSRMIRRRKDRQGERFTSVEQAMAALDVLEERTDRLWDRLDALLDRAMEIEEGEQAIRSQHTNSGQKGSPRARQGSFEES